MDALVHFHVIGSSVILQFLIASGFYSVLDLVNKYVVAFQVIW
jgi:hypothetical protein